MTNETKDKLLSKSVFSWIALATALVLLVPLVAMKFTDEVRWNLVDFIAMGALLFTTASLAVVVSRKVPRERRILIVVGFAIVFLYIWAELAVGIFTNLGS